MCNKNKIILLLSLTILIIYNDHLLAKGKNLIIVTATPGGTYYPVGVAIGTLITLKCYKEYGITATAIDSAGSAENIQMLENNEADLATLQSLFGSMAYQGKGIYKKPLKNILAITSLWDNVEHFVLLNKYVKSGNIKDIKGLKDKFSIGKRGSGTEVSGKTILSSLDIELNKLNLEYLGYQDSVDAMLDRRLAGANIPAGVPASAISMLFAMEGSKGVSILEFTSDQLDRINSNYPVWKRYIIRKDIYPRLNRDVFTIAQSNFLGVKANLDVDTVYIITKTIFENLSFLYNIHSATRAINLENAIQSLPVPLHPGALKYYRERGLNIPKRLIVDSK
ncbi:MAG: TAXI family TRAP transporter solute-binding subunit [Deferribacterota bacterium]|nr:TAXI family TRAP transporter solute-binding subunit [Deferribacterota bacterium]